MKLPFGNTPSIVRGRDTFAPALRSLGLDYADKVFRRGPERAKEIISRSRWVAFSRSLVHVLPTSGLVVLVWLNYRTYYFGPYLGPEIQSYLFIAAKFEELLCVASLTAIFLRTLRHELLNDGVPLGLLGSGLYFTGVSFAWSSPFLGSLSGASRTWGMVRLYFMLFLCGFIALAIGPASNVLMQPREQTFPAGRTKFYLNGTAEEFWPDTIDARSTPALCTWTNATDYDICPSSGYRSISETFASFHWNSVCPSTGGSYSPLCQAFGAEGNRQWKSFVAQSPQHTIPPLIRSFREAFWGDIGSTAIQPHAATAIVMDQLRYLWSFRAKLESGKGNSWNSEIGWYYDMETEGPAISPFVRAHCLGVQNLTAEATEAGFPKLLPKENGGKNGRWTSWDYKDGTHDISSLNRTASAYIRTQWMTLPIETFGDLKTGISTNGLLVELPWIYNSRAAIACAIAAAWHNTTLLSQRSRNYNAFRIKLSSRDFLNHDDSPESDATNRPITLDHSWLALLTPAAPADRPGPQGVALNTLESHLYSMKIDVVPDMVREDPTLVLGQDKRNKTDAQLWHSLGRGPGDTVIAPLIAMTVADGLSRYGSQHIRLNLGDPIGTFGETQVFKDLRGHATPPSRNATGEMKLSIWGWSYYASKTSDKIALACVSMYLALVVIHLGHTFLWPVLSGKPMTSSDAWDSITELLVLCLNSPPPPPSTRLENTSSGIKSLQKYGTLIKVRADNIIEKPGAPRIRLILDEDLKEQSRVTGSKSSFDCELQSADVPLSADNDQEDVVSSPNDELKVAATSTSDYSYSHFRKRLSRVVPGRKYG